MEKHKFDLAKKAFNKIKELGHKSSDNSKLNDVGVCIPIYGRHRIVHAHVINLTKQNTDVLLGVSTLNDYFFAMEMKARYESVKVVVTQNYPLGLKCQQLIDYAKKSEYDYLMFCGSDGLLSSNYVNVAKEKINSGLGLVGSYEWKMLNTDGKLYHMSYKQKKIILGGGRMFSKDTLEKLKYNLFDKTRPFGLDQKAHNATKKLKIPIGSMPSSEFILSVKSGDDLNSGNKLLKGRRINNKIITDVKSIIEKMGISSLSELKKPINYEHFLKQAKKYNTRDNLTKPTKTPKLTRQNKRVKPKKRNKPTPPNEFSDSDKEKRLERKNIIKVKKSRRHKVPPNNSKLKKNIDKETIKKSKTKILKQPKESVNQFKKEIKAAKSNKKKIVIKRKFR